MFNNAVFICTILNVILTIFNIIFHFKSSKRNDQEIVKYVQSRKKVKYPPQDRPQFRARAPSNTELYDRELHGEKKH